MKALTGSGAGVGGAAGLTASGGPAVAQYARHKGKILVSEKPVPTKQEEVDRWIKKDTSTTLKANKGGDSWEFHYVAVLTKAPPVNVVNLVFYEAAGGGYKYINAEDVKVAAQTNVIIGKAKMHKLLGFARGKRYQIRVTVKDNQGVERIFARSAALLLK
ncbi:MAG: hypothetical protein RBU30_17285 [Polyangia bacterium]|jgi:hypothetical protein|nr:hypothetical protein [Polyangia bacterium]